MRPSRHEAGTTTGRRGVLALHASGYLLRSGHPDLGSRRHVPRVQVGKLRHRECALSVRPKVERWGCEGWTKTSWAQTTVHTATHARRVCLISDQEPPVDQEEEETGE